MCSGPSQSIALRSAIMTGQILSALMLSKLGRSPSVPSSPHLMLTVVAQELKETDETRSLLKSDSDNLGKCKI